MEEPAFKRPRDCLAEPPALCKVRAKKVVVDASTTLEPGFVVIADGRIAAVEKDELSLSIGKELPVSHEADVIVPGFVDIHTHGIGGADEIGEFWRNASYTLGKVVRYGTTAVLATMVLPLGSSDASRKKQLFCKCSFSAECKCSGFAPRVAESVERIASGLNVVCGKLGLGAVLEGIHAEGPVVETFGGLPHSDTDISLEAFESLLGMLGPALRIMTIAPSVEARAACKFARLSALIKRRVRPALGHDTACTEKEIAEALTVAASLGMQLHITHAFNVQRFHHRNCGLANIAALPRLPNLPIFEKAELPTAEVIGDCVHVAPAVLQLIASCKPLGSACFITDGIAEPKAGATLRYCEREAFVKERDGKLAVYSTAVDHGGEVLIGSCAMMLDAFRTAVNVLGASLCRAVDMCCSTPASVAMLPHLGSLHVGKRADIVLLSDQLEVECVLVAGSVAHSARSPP
eukprot:TRINITY_DN70042_c0_g1_i1.p1 TRINITY_DN70042_c0_g1~~TRINITY_DN70042_c0_g1_i1.p1  ORF type:complete len:463 (+),score=68.55 TRINITY_DN70042_c0_g1_i1:61-1449(+)